MKRALVTGATGMDGAILCEMLLGKGYEVHGMVRRSSSFNRERLEHLLNNSDIKHKTLFLHYGDLSDGTNVAHLVNQVKPDLLLNTAAQSHVKISFDVPEYSAQTDALGTLRLLEAVRHSCPDAKFVQFSTSEMFGKVQETPQKETTPFYPRSPYAAAKCFAYWVTRNYREAYNLKTWNSICFNHECSTRGENFVTRKISLSAARIKYGLQDKVVLGNLAAKRDWGWANDYCRGILMMAGNSEPGEFVFATGETHTVEEFCFQAFACIGIPLTFSGEGIERKGYDEDGNIRVEVSPEYFRPTEVDFLLGDATKARETFGWEPTVKFYELVRMMVESDLELVGRSYGR